MSDSLILDAKRQRVVKLKQQIENAAVDRDLLCRQFDQRTEQAKADLARLEKEIAAAAE